LKNLCLRSFLCVDIVYIRVMKTLFLVQQITYSISHEWIEDCVGNLICRASNLKNFKWPHLGFYLNILKDSEK
jgi:hypothetical protein